jgi:hypothetical protein
VHLFAVRGNGDGPTSIPESGSIVIQSELRPKFPSVKLRHIKEFLSQNEIEAPIVAYPDYPNYPEVSDPQHQPDNLDSPSSDSSGFALDFDKLFSEGFTIIVGRAIRNLDFVGAEKVLEEALAQHKSSGLFDIDHRRIRIQLVLANLLQTKGPQMEESILDLAEFYAANDPISRQLVYALALSHADEKNWHSSQRICKRLWQALRNVDSSPTPHHHEVLQILATSCRGSGESVDILRATAIEEGFPDVNFGPRHQEQWGLFSVAMSF